MTYTGGIPWCHTPVAYSGGILWWHTLVAYRNGKQINQDNLAGETILGKRIISEPGFELRSSGSNYSMTYFTGHSVNLASLTQKLTFALSYVNTLEWLFLNVSLSLLFEWRTDRVWKGRD